MFDLSELLKNAAVPDSGTGTPEQIEYLPLEDLRADDNNFYALSDIDALAANIEFAGLQQPIRVRRADDGGYIIVSGHRRAAALRKIVEDGNEAFASVPCIVERAGGSAALNELRLIYANSDTRRMTPAEISRQAERVEALLYALKEEGVEFPGRMRDHVAEACKVSKSKLSRLKVIRDGLDPQILRDYFEQDKLNEATAYELARLSHEDQWEIVLRATDANDGDLGYLYAHNVVSQSKDIDRLKSMSCPANPKADGCGNRFDMLDKLYKSGYRGYAHCGDGCCYDCPDICSCKTACNLCAEQKAALQLVKKSDAEEQKRAQAERDKPTIDALRLLWGRAAAAADAAGVDYFAIARAAGLVLASSADEGKLLKPDARITAMTNGPFGYTLSVRSVKALVSLAERLDCSLDYLFGRDVSPSTTPRGGDGRDVDAGG